MLKYRFKGKKISLLTKSVRLPNGRRTELEMVLHPGAVCVVPVTSAGQVLMLRQFRATIQQYLYEVPAGTLDPGESFLACAKRELVEETGFRGRKFKRLGQIYPVPGYSNERIVIFRADGLSVEEGTKDPDEIIEVRPLSRAQVLRLFRQGRIQDAKTICSLAFCGIL